MHYLSIYCNTSIIFQAASDKKKGKADDKNDRAKSSKKGGKKTPETPQAKEGSKLKKRGEEDGECRYIGQSADGNVLI